MRTVPFLMALMVGISTAAMQQQRPSPVYPAQVTSTGSTTSSLNGPPMKSTSALSSSPLSTPAPPNPALPYQPVAQARESIASEASMMQSAAVGPSTPSQNYYVYYYPQNGGTVRQPDNSSLLSWVGWHDVAAGVGSLALVLVGGGILYSRYGSDVKSRALRELKDLTTEDAARMARKVLQALEKFSTINNHTE